MERSSATDQIRVLAIAPTRALVNDLFARLQRTLEELGIGCGRQTSDHRLGAKLPFLLITTPESLDSMLARRTKYGADGKPEGHLLQSVEAVFIDEAHLFDNTARGDQLLWLLARLRRLKRGAQVLPASSQSIQVCAASATVSSPSDLAHRLLGTEATVVAVPGGRELLVYDDDGAVEPWSPITEDDTVASVLPRVALPLEADSLSALAESVWRAMSRDAARPVRKMLVFVPSRSLCDELSTVLRQYLESRRQVAVFAHHGSLDKGIREAAEQGFGTARDAVLVATSTLEVGVDIGDVDVVALVGPPADTNGLLQRIGRSGRRLGITRVLAIARSAIDRFAMASMLVAARDGICDPIRYGRRWSVCVQQVSSFIRQGPSAGRRISDVLELASQVWPEDGALGAQLVVDGLIEQGLVESGQGGRLRFGEAWQLIWDGMGMHGNIDGAAAGTPVVDAVTGETVAHIPVGSRVPERISIAGANWTVKQGSGEILLQGSALRGSQGSIRYGSRRGPVSRAFARHLALGLGLSDRDLVSYSRDGETLVFHFGGSVYERVLSALMVAQPVAGLAGIALRGPLRHDLAALCSDPRRVEAVLMSCLDDSPSLVAPGPMHSLLPASLRSSTFRELMPADDFLQWVRTRQLTDVPAEHRIAAKLASLLA
jgi:ATP-dependent Lhr-like helicase